MIRAFADAYYEKYSTLFSGNPRLKEYYDWLQKRADWLDPLVENDYDQFLKDIYKKGLSIESGDLFETMYNRQEVACNILGGAKGFFGAESIHIFPYHYDYEYCIEEDGSIGLQWITK